MVVYSASSQDVSARVEEIAESNKAVFFSEKLIISFVCSVS